ncbi:MAG TPA: zf-HC2 domain-containing protein [Acidimicrobiia bacterium]|jgi:predicted anti-sigma-YlaC factor YlaD
MDCDRCRIALSAALDGEDAGADDDEVRGHVASCAACAAFAAGAGPLHRAARVAPADPVPDLSEPILRRIGDEPDPMAVDDRTRFLRISLAIIGAIQLAMAVPALVLGDDAGLPTHAARHLGSFALALGVGLLVVAWKPERASGVLPVVAALVACLIGSSILDIVQGNAAPGAEVSHAPELVGLVAVWLLTRVPEEHARHRTRPVLG